MSAARENAAGLVPLAQRRASARPDDGWAADFAEHVPPLLAELATAAADRDEALVRLGEADGQAQAVGRLDARRACADQLADATRDRVAVPDDVRAVLESLIDEWRYR